MLVHGQWNYHRVSKLILYSFYKNACFMWLQFFYSFETVGAYRRACVRACVRGPGRVCVDTIAGTCCLTWGVHLKRQARN